MYCRASGLVSLLVYALLILTVSPDAHAAEGEEACIVPASRTDVRPNPSGPVTIVRTGIRIADLLNIDDVNQTITVDFVIRKVWTDPRLVGLEGCELPKSSTWHPEIVLENSGRLFERWPETVSIGRNGQVTYLQRVSGTLASHHSLHDFPFDYQSIKLRYFPLEYDPSEVALVLDEGFTGVGDRLNISDWILDSFVTDIHETQIKAFSEGRSTLDFTLNINRIKTFYIWKIIIPLSLIVFMSWCVFWIDSEHYGTQIGFSATSMLTMIAFVFATTNMIPALGYFTKLDIFIGGATILVFLSLIVALTTSYLVSVESRQNAKTLDRVCRFAFPVLFFGFSLVTFFREI